MTVERIVELFTLTSVFDAVATNGINRKENLPLMVKYMILRLWLKDRKNSLRISYLHLK